MATETPLSDRMEEFKVMFGCDSTRLLIAGGKIFLMALTYLTHNTNETDAK